MDMEDTSFNAEIKMLQEVETIRTVPEVDFQTFENVESIIGDDLTYIMQSTFIHPLEEMDNACLSDHQDTTSEESDSDTDDDSDDEVRITLVKDKNIVSHKEDTINISSEEEEEEVVEKTPFKKANKIKDKIVSGNLMNNDDATEVCVDTERTVIESDESIVHKLLKELVKNTIKVLQNECTGEKDLDYFSDDSMSSENETALLSIIRGENQVSNHIPRVPNEVLAEELVVDVEDIILTPKDHLNQIGVISGFVEKMVVVKSHKDAPALDGESAFFFENQNYMGKVFDTFGPVKVPYYTVHLSKNVDVSTIKDGTKVYYVPFNQEITKYVFIEQLKKLKGSDASWRNDWEPPVASLDYSDDEEEQHVKRQHKIKKKTVNLSINREQKNTVDTINHCKSKSQNVKGVGWKPVQVIHNPHLSKPNSHPSINDQNINQLQHHFGSKSLFQDSNITNIIQNIKIPRLPILPILQPQIPIIQQQIPIIQPHIPLHQPRIPLQQPLIRQEIKNITSFCNAPPPLSNNFRPPNYEINQNMQSNNGNIFPASFPQQLPPPFGILQNQRLQMPPQNLLMGRPQLPVFAPQFPIQPGTFSLLNNRPPCNVLPSNTHPFLGNSVPVANSQPTTCIPFGHCPPLQNLIANQSLSQVINNTLLSSSGNVLPSNLIPNNQQRPNMSQFSLNSVQDSRKKSDVKLNGFTFKI